MFTVGVDPHKQLLVACAINDLGRTVSTWSGSNDQAGWDSFLIWTASLDGPALVGIEGAYSYGQGLARAATTAGLTTFDINPRWTARERRLARRTDKSDADDARAVARFTLREFAALEALVAPSDSPREQLAILVRDRRELLQDTIRLRNQVHARLSALDPPISRPSVASPASMLPRLSSTSPQLFRATVPASPSTSSTHSPAAGWRPKLTLPILPAASRNSPGATSPP